MKKLQIVFVLLLCFVSFSAVQAESLIIPSNGTINEYLKYRAGCRTSISDCFSANGLESIVESDIRGILSNLPKQETDFQRIEKAREQLRKDNESAYKQLQDDLKRLSSSIDTNIKTGFTCVQPVALCTQSTYDRIRGIAIGSGLTPDQNQLTQCQSQIDDYNKKLQEYNQCQQDYINQKIEHSAQMEYEAQLLTYKTGLLKADKWCKDKEGYYSSYNKDTKECQCVAGATFINGWCQSDAQIQIDNLLVCVQKYGSLAKYDSIKNTCLAETETMPATRKEKTLSENKYTPVAESNTPKTTTTPSPEVKATPKAKTTEKIAPKGVTKPEMPVAQLQNNQILANQKTSFWQRLKNNIFKIKFW